MTPGSLPLGCSRPPDGLRPLHPLPASPLRPSPLSRMRTGRLVRATNSAPPELRKPETVQAAEPVAASRASQVQQQQNGFPWSPWSVVASSQAFAQQLLSHFSRWPGSQMPQPEQVLQAASTMERVKQKEKHAAPVDVSPYLHGVAVWEMKHIRKLSSLCALTYLPHKVNTESLRRRHKLELVLSSWACAQQPPSEPRTPEEVGLEGDGMAVSVTDVNTIYAQAAAARQDEEAVSITLASPDAPMPLVLPAGAGISLAVTNQRQAVADAVTAKLAEAAAAASAAAAAAASPLASAAMSAASPLASAAGSIYAGLASLPLPGLRGGDALSSRDGASVGEAGPSLLGAGGSSGGTGSARGSGGAGAAAVGGGAALGAGVIGLGGPVLFPSGQAALVNTVASVALDEVRTTISIPTLPALSSVVPAATPSPPPTSGYAPLPPTPSSAPATTSSAAASFSSFSRPSAPQPFPPSFAAPVAASQQPATTSLAAVPQGPPTLCPSEWFVCDDPVHHTRIFAIQGSDTIDHWRLNLTFDPVTFEDPALGVTVHRGVYEAAKVLYEKFLPLVYEHLDSSPFARVTFTGHSIGGSMAVLLMLMYKRRGVLTNRSISTVYTFGAPSVFCETPLTPWQEERQGEQDSAPCTTGGPSRLLAALGLKEQAVRNVMMSRDIVPRAFACDYSLVADILKSWGQSFREHVSLSLSGRKHLYYFVGRMIVLQPDRWHVFVNNEPDHPLLPPGPGLYYIAEPSDMLVPRPLVSEAGRADAGGGSAAAGGGGAKDSDTGAKDSSNSSVADSSSSSGGQAGKAGKAGKGGPPASAPSALSKRPRPGKVPPSARAALMELMDCPHPLETLADPGAYMDTGSISRYHNPDNYTLAFGRITYLRRKQEMEATGRPLALWPLAPGRAGARRSRETESLRSAAPSVWDSSDDQDASLNSILLPAESNLYT